MRTAGLSDTRGAIGFTCERAGVRGPRGPPSTARRTGRHLTSRQSPQQRLSSRSFGKNCRIQAWAYSQLQAKLQAFV